MRDELIEVMTLTPVLFVLIGLGVAVLLDSCTRDAQRRMMLLILLVEILLVAQNYAGYLMEPLSSAGFAKTVVSSTSYILRPLMFVLFFRLLYGDAEPGAEKLLRKALALSPGKTFEAIAALECTEAFKEKLREIAKRI